ncbi:hypothetical protein PH505_bb00100 [Pseudoalteromonas distincta]|uniref:hypothetical protein n=1 Tax=Pseudoalteromonas distincta TaxID=77608 RepID=UPI00020A0BAF|nr:hypothetical protein [Pseudoalteromonas distincta]EGI72862.1 hypothetical protein PH505_bb00100 [Pseudoalteromonas distincta]
MAKGLVSAGNVFNNWTVISEAERDSKRAQQFLCKCVCGIERVVKKYNLGNMTGCGCVRANSKPYKPRAKKVKKPSPKSIFLSTVQPRRMDLPKPIENQECRPEYKERRKSTRELIEERKEQARLDRLLKEEWAQ